MTLRGREIWSNSDEEGEYVMTNEELERALAVQALRINALENLIRALVSTSQLNAVTLLLESDMQRLNEVVVSQHGRISALETIIAG